MSETSEMSEMNGDTFPTSPAMTVDSAPAGDRRGERTKVS